MKLELEQCGPRLNYQLRHPLLINVIFYPAIKAVKIFTQGGSFKGTCDVGMPNAHSSFGLS